MEVIMFGIIKNLVKKSENSKLAELQEKVYQLEQELFLANKDNSLMTSDLGVAQEKQDKLTREIEQYRQMYENLKLQNDDYKKKFDLIFSIVNSDSFV